MLIEDCSVSGNKLNGVLVRDGAAPLLLRNSIIGNGAFGVVLQVRMPGGRSRSHDAVWIRITAGDGSA